MLKRLVEKGRSKCGRISPGQQQLPFAFDISLNLIPDEWHQVAVRLGEPMALVMATENEVFGECVERICVEVGRKMMGLGLVWPDCFR
jgi:hypothetical protein